MKAVTARMLGSECTCFVLNRCKAQLSTSDGPTLGLKSFRVNANAGAIIGAGEGPVAKRWHVSWKRVAKTLLICWRETSSTPSTSALL
jgi:hypothetical protein